MRQTKLSAVLRRLESSSGRVYGYTFLDLNYIGQEDSYNLYTYDFEEALRNLQDILGQSEPLFNFDMSIEEVNKVLDDIAGSEHWRLYEVRQA